MMMDIHEFSDRLIQTRDLDPVYVAIWGARLSEPQLCRLLLAYWCFYHLGTAGWLSEHEGESYWTWMRVAAENATSPRHVASRTDHDATLPAERWPRAAERRHFRGDKCVATVEWLRSHSNGSAESWVRVLTDARTEKEVMARVQNWPLFGPWIAFKAADMMERVYGAHIEFSRNIGLMYDEPRAALNILAAPKDDRGRVQLGPYQERPAVIYEALSAYISALRAPPALDRPCGPQEVETCLCKWKSHYNGHYTVGKDIREVRHGLAGWGETADRMLAAAPQEVP